MSNKLKKIFNNNDSLYKGTIRFKDIESRKDFEDMLEKVLRNGELIKPDVAGIESISTGIESGNEWFSLDDGGTVVNLVVGPAVEKVHQIPLIIDDKNTSVTLLQYRIQDGIILQTKNDFSFDIKIIVYATREVKLNVSPHFERTSKTEKLLYDVAIAEQLIAFLFVDNSDDDDSQISIVKQYLKEIKDLFSTLNYVEVQLDKEFDPSTINVTDTESCKDLFELSLVLSGKAIRLNAKLHPSDETGIQLTEPKELAIGNAIALTYRGEIEYYLWNDTITLYTANILNNAIVKATKKLDNGNTQIFYGDTDSKPMYIAYKCFKSIEDANTELSTLMDHKKEYDNAKTVEQYWKDRIIE